MTRPPLVVVALGGNALLCRGQPSDDATQRANIKAAAKAIAELAAGHRLVVTHGNGPQVGLLALQADAYDPDHPARLDLLDAETEGAIGYLLEQELSNELPDLEVAAILTRTLVDLGDPAFARPTKPIGPTYTREVAERLAAEHGWAVARDGDTYRRVVASPEPQAIAELHTIERLVDDGVVVVAAGGGGVPVALDVRGDLTGVDAVVDKDLAAALLAERLGADRLLLLTDVFAVQLDFAEHRPPGRSVRRAPTPCASTASRPDPWPPRSKPRRASPTRPDTLHRSARSGRHPLSLPAGAAPRSGPVEPRSCSTSAASNPAAATREPGQRVGKAATTVRAGHGCQAPPENPTIDPPTHRSRRTQ